MTHYTIDTNRASAIREFCMLPLDAQYDHSMVFQVDVHWIMKTHPDPETQERRQHGALSSQTDYVFGTFHKDPEIRLYQDPFGLFQNYQGSGKSERRIDYFENKYYIARGKGGSIDDDVFRKIGSDRVPYMWDFGFLLLQKSAWDQAADCRVTKDRTVQQVWDHLRDNAIVSWREFLGACAEIVKYSRLLDGQKSLAFDIAGGADSVACFLLEMWMSELKPLAALIESDPYPAGTSLEDGLNFLSTPKYDPREFNKRVARP